MMRLLKETRQQLDDLQRQQAAASPGTPLATLAPAPVTEDEANRYIAMFENASVGRTVLGLFLPLLAAAGVGSGVWWLTSWALATVAMASSFILWPILIIVAAVVVGAMLMWKVAGMTGSYILTGKADQHAATVWGWVSSPFRSVEVKHAVKQVEAKVDRLQAGLA